MYFANKATAKRQMRPLHCWLWVFTLFLVLATWLPASAQTPETVVLPPFKMRMPFLLGEALDIGSCPLTSANVYETTPILGEPRKDGIAARLDPDLNLMVRGYQPITATLELIGINGPTDDDAPQLANLFRPVRVPTFSAAYQVRDWDWACCPGGKLGQPINDPAVTLLEMAIIPGESLYPPGRNASIGHDFVALVLYAEQYRLTFTYTREDTPAVGYLVHVEGLCVDPNLVALYEEMHLAGRNNLPALRRSDSIGTAQSPSIMVAVRDTGSFMDPRSGKDWWQDTVRALLAAQGAQP